MRNPNPVIAILLLNLVYLISKKTKIITQKAVEKAIPSVISRKVINFLKVLRIIGKFQVQLYLKFVYNT
jgi:hypothetical protein